MVNKVQQNRLPVSLWHIGNLYLPVPFGISWDHVPELRTKKLSKCDFPAPSRPTSWTLTRAVRFVLLEKPGTS